MDVKRSTARRAGHWETSVLSSLREGKKNTFAAAAIYRMMRMENTLPMDTTM